MTALSFSNVNLLDTPLLTKSFESAPVVLIASDVKDPHTFLDKLPVNAVIRYVDSWLNSLEEILCVAGQIMLGDIHFVCHGREGRPLLAGKEVSFGELNQSKTLLSQLDAVLGQRSTLYFHAWERSGCVEGDCFVSELSSLTRLPVVCSAYH